MMQQDIETIIDNMAAKRFHWRGSLAKREGYEIALKEQFIPFIQHLIDTRVIDCASHEDIMQRWTDFQNS